MTATGSKTIHCQFELSLTHKGKTMKTQSILLMLALAGQLLVAHTVNAGPEYSERYVKRLSDMAAHPERTGNPYRIFIVDNFRDVDVDAFLDDQFGNIQNVMFTSVIVTDKYGQPKRSKKTGRFLVEDDGC